MHRRTRAAFVGIITIWWWSIGANSETAVFRNEDICGFQNGRRLYLELGEKGVLYAKNVSFAKNERRIEGSRVYTSNSSHAQCTFELVTCPSCVIIATFQSIALSHHCGDGSVTMDSPCRCDYVWISEPPYEDVSGTPFCGMYAPITYRSSTRTLSITLLYSQSHKHAFTLEYTSERNRLQLRGAELTATGQPTKGLNNTGGGILTSPFFPARYPRDLGLEYVVTCPTEAPSCHIRLLFSDFQLATVSIMEFYDWNGQRIDVSSGARFRPPVIMSSGPSLLIRFYANGGTGLGYKAFYSFVIGHSLDKSVQPITDCGGYVENLGGTITMMDMVDEGLKTYDCVWLIRPPKNFLHMKTHMYLKVITFIDMAGNTELVVKQGPTSALLPLEILRHPASQVQPPRHREHVAPVSSGFHVSLRGTFGPSSRLAIAYAAFSYTDCFAGSDFLCRNHRCVANQLNCDGFDHCGDNSDEPATCFRDWEMEPQDRKWHANKPNYYFPKIDRYPDLKTATLVFVASSLGLIVLISALIVLLYRMGARARQQRELQSRLQTISELLDGARIDEISVSDEPPVYEAPPGYDEVVKLGLESEIVARKKGGKYFVRGPPSRVFLSNESSSSDMVRSSSCGTAESASTSQESATRATSVPTVSKKDSSRVPESPPPPYATPTSSTSRYADEDANVSVRDDGGPQQGWFRRDDEEEDDEEDDDDVIRATNQVLEAAAELNIDAEFFGAYRDASCSIPSVDSTCDSQRRISCDASNEGKPSCDDVAGEDGGEMVEEEQRQEELVEEHVPEDVRVDSDVPVECNCEGACGCATVRRNLAIVCPRTSEQSQLLWRRQMKKDEEEVDGSGRGKKMKDEDSEEEEEENKWRSTLTRLLGTRAVRGQNGSEVSTVASTTSSTPCETLRRSMRKFSPIVRPRKAFSTARYVGSYEKLNNTESEVSRCRSIGLHASDPVSIGSCESRRGCRRYSSCDLESLYEGIRILDGFLARRGVAAVTHTGRKQSVTVMLFGTPEHGTIGRLSGNGEDRIREVARVSRYSLDALSN